MERMDSGASFGMEGLFPRELEMENFFCFDAQSTGGLADGAGVSDAPMASTSHAAAGAAPLRQLGNRSAALSSAPNGMIPVAHFSAGAGFLPACSASCAGGSESAADVGACSEPAGGKRAAGGKQRRVRNARQAELNRSGQQRYRARRKERYPTLASAVDALTAQMAQMRTLEGENAKLAAGHAALTRVVALQEAEILAQRTHVARQQGLLREQARQLGDARAALEAARAELGAQEAVAGVLQARLVGAAAAGVADAAGAGGLALAPAAMVERVAGAIRSAMADGAAAAAAAPAVLPDAVVAAIKQTVSACCREALAARRAPPAPPAIQVPCC